MIGEKLSKLRKENGISQEELAEKLNISRQAISKWENNESLPDTENLIAIAKLFNVSIDFLVPEAIELLVITNVLPQSLHL